MTAAKKPTSETQKDTIDFYLPFITEIRNRLLFIFAVFLISSIIGFSYYENIVTTVIDTFRFVGVNIVFTSPFQFINLAVSSGLMTGLIVVFPIIIYQTLSFLKPALNKNEFKMLLVLAPLAVVLFAIGFGYGFTMMRYVISLFYQKSLDLDVGNFLDISRLLSQILVTSALMGVAFQFPIILTGLLRLHVIPYKTVAKQRTISYAGSLIFAALLPPTDLLSLALLTLPLVVLFELTLLFNKTVLNITTPAKKGGSYAVRNRPH